MAAGRNAGWTGAEGFISYSHKDREFVDRLYAKLKALEVTGLVRFFRDTQDVQVGEKWDPAVRSALQRSSIVLAVLSDDFFLSDYITSHELPEMLRLAQQRTATVVPIVARECLWKHTALGEYIGLPEGASSVVNAQDPESVLQEIGEAIARRSTALLPARPVYTEPPLHYGEHERGQTTKVSIKLAGRYSQAVARKVLETAEALRDTVGGALWDLDVKAGSVIVSATLKWSTLDSALGLLRASIPLLPHPVTSIRLEPSGRQLFGQDSDPSVSEATLVNVVDSRFIDEQGTDRSAAEFAGQMARQLDFDSFHFDDMRVGPRSLKHVRFNGRALAVSVTEVPLGADLEGGLEPPPEDSALTFGSGCNAVVRIADERDFGRYWADVLDKPRKKTGLPLVAQRVRELAPGRRVVVVYSNDPDFVFGLVALLTERSRRVSLEDRSWPLGWGVEEAAGDAGGRSRSGSGFIWVRTRDSSSREETWDSTYSRYAALVSSVVDTTVREIGALSTASSMAESAVFPVNGGQTLVESLRLRATRAISRGGGALGGPSLARGEDGQVVPVWNA